MKAFSESRIYKEPLNPQWNEMMKVIDDKLALFFFNKATVDQTVDSIQQGMDKIYNQ
jgi:multiple sugar transport system substrate-binding protein